MVPVQLPLWLKRVSKTWICLDSGKPLRSNFCVIGRKRFAEVLHSRLFRHRLECRNNGWAMESVLTGIEVIVLTTVLAVGGFLCFRRFVKADYLNRHHDIADPMLSLLGTLYSVLLGFLVAGAVSQFDEAKETVHAEANAVANIFRLSYAFPDNTRDTVRKLCVDYCNEVVNNEWKQMGTDRELSVQGWVIYERLWHACLKIDASNPAVANAHAAILEAIDDAGAMRRERAIAVNRGLPAALWLVTVFGSVMIITFTYFFSAEKTALQCWMIAMVAASLGLNIFLLVVFSAPFSGVMKISATAFQLNLDLFNHNMNAAEVSDVEP